MAQSNFSRRGFLGAAAATGIGVATASTIGPLAGTANAAMGVAAPNVPLPGLGLQLYSVRDKVAELGFEAVFAELARIGFKEIEFAGYSQRDVGPITVPEIKALLDEYGLTAIGAHIGRNQLLGIPGNNQSVEEAKASQRQAFENAVILGMPYIGTANDFNGQSTADIIAEAERFNEAGALAMSEYGLKIYQHNHANEYRFTTDDFDMRRYDVFLEHTNPATVFLEMDILWAHGGARKYAVAQEGTQGVPNADATFGFDPADYIVANPGRFPLFHVKDGTPREDPTSGNSFSDVEFGAGNIPFRAFFDAIGARAESHPLWEQDSAPNTPEELGGSFGAAQRSFTAMHDLRTLTWLDELLDMLDSFSDDDRLAGHVANSLRDRLERALALAESGSETRTANYLRQFVARAQNQIKGDSDDAAVRALLVNAGMQVLAWLAEAEDNENEL